GRRRAPARRHLPRAPVPPAPRPGNVAAAHPGERGPARGTAAELTDPGEELSRSASSGVHEKAGAMGSGCSRPEGSPMTLELPGPVAAYFAADREDGDAVSLCFTEAAVVKDEGHTHRGRAAIKQWKADASARFQYTSEPLACVRKDGTVVVTSRLTGNF